MANIITNVNQACADLANIKRAIVNNGVAIPSGTPSSEYARKIDKVYEVGFQDGSQGGDSGGSMDEFWNAVQENGYRTDYSRGFVGYTWNDITFRPKYDIAPEGDATSMFEACQVTDLEAILNDCNVSLITEKIDNWTNAFAGSSITCLPNLTFTSWVYSAERAFADCEYLERISFITFDYPSTDFIDTFSGCTSLYDVTFDGYLTSSINMGDCPLTRESIESLIGTLSNAVSGMTVTLNQAAVEEAFSDDEWEELISTKPQWIFELV